LRWQYLPICAMSYSSPKNFKDTLKETLKDTVKEVGLTLLIFMMVYGMVYLIHQILLLID